MALLDEIKELIAEQLDIKLEKIEKESKFIDDLNADSLDIVELMMALEEKFDIKIPDSEAEKIITVNDILVFIEELQKK